MKILFFNFILLALILYASAAPTKSKEKVADETIGTEDTTVIGDVKVKEQTTIDSKTVSEEEITTETVSKLESIETADTTKGGLNLGKLPLSKLWTPYGIMAPTSGNAALPVRVRGQNKNMFSMMRPMQTPRWNKNTIKQNSGLDLLTIRKENGSRDGNGNDVAKKNETRIQERKTRKEKTKASWTTTLANGESIKENIVLSRGSNVMMLRSETDNFKALTIIDFNSKIHAIKIRMKKSEKEDKEEKKEEEEKVEEKNVEKKKVEHKRKFNFLSKIRQLRHKQRHSKSQRELCFITETDVNMDEVYMEIDAREKNKTVKTGSAHVFYVNGDDNVSKGEMKKTGFWIKTFCKKAAAAGKMYNLVSESTAEMNPEPIVVIGQIDVSQKGKSVPYKINLESSIDIHS